MKPLLVILDINGTLLCKLNRKAKGESVEVLRSTTLADVSADQTLTSDLFFRPNMKQFLAEIKALPSVTVAIWTSATKRNADIIIQKGLRFKPHLVFCQDHCTPIKTGEGKRPILSKDLEVVWKRHPQFNCYNTILIDNSNEKIVQPGNWLQIKEYFPVNTGSVVDNELMQVLNIIKFIATGREVDVRKYLYNGCFIGTFSDFESLEMKFPARSDNIGTNTTDDIHLLSSLAIESEVNSSSKLATITKEESNDCVDESIDMLDKLSLSLNDEKGKIYWNRAQSMSNSTKSHHKWHKVSKSSQFARTRTDIIQPTHACTAEDVEIPAEAEETTVEIPVEITGLAVECITHTIPRSNQHNFRISQNVHSISERERPTDKWYQGQGSNDRQEAIQWHKHSIANTRRSIPNENNSTPKICAFYPRNCKNGTSCRFTHL